MAWTVQASQVDGSAAQAFQADCMLGQACLAGCKAVQGTQEVPGLELGIRKHGSPAHAQGSRECPAFRVQELASDVVGLAEQGLPREAAGVEVVPSACVYSHLPSFSDQP